MKLFRFKGALRLSDDTLVDAEAKELQEVFVLPFTLGSDHAEGMTCRPCLGYDAALLIVYDAPHPARRVGRAGLLADIFRL